MKGKLEDIKLYVKPEDNTVYFVANENYDVTYNVSL